MRNLIPIETEGTLILPNGCSLYWKPNEVGGRSYYTNECAVGHLVWDTAITDEGTLLAALTQENKLRHQECINKHRMKT
jgi:hypothetical protein